MSTVNKDNINHYFDWLQEAFDDHDFSAHLEAIYNMDEKVIAAKGQKKYGNKVQDKNNKSP